MYIHSLHKGLFVQRNCWTAVNYWHGCLTVLLGSALTNRIQRAKCSFVIEMCTCISSFPCYNLQQYKYVLPRRNRFNALLHSYICIFISSKYVRQSYCTPVLSKQIFSLKHEIEICGNLINSAPFLPRRVHVSDFRWRHSFGYIYIIPARL